MRGMEICGLTNCLLSSAEVVNGCVQTHVGLEIDAVTQVVHDLLNTDGKEVPCSLDVVLAWKDRHNSGILRHSCGLVGLSTRAIGRVRVFG
jgi:hypothetical protein